MKNNNHLGRNSLIIAFSGTVILFISIHLGYLTHASWYIVLAGFEAATVGGVADWFAVRALFREIPIPVVRKHTNIIVKSRAKLSSGITDLVANEWLSKESIRDRLSQFSIVSKLLPFLRERQVKVQLANLGKIAIKQFSSKDNIAKLTSSLEGQIAKQDLGKPLGNWIQQVIRKQDHHGLWQFVLQALEQSINTEETRQIIIEKVAHQTDGIKDEGGMKSLFMSAAQLFGGMDDETVADKLIDTFNQILDQIVYDAHHPVRVRVDGYLLDFGERLSEGEPKAEETIVQMQQRLLENVGNSDWVNSLVQKLVSGLEFDLENEQSNLFQMIDRQIDNLLDKLENDQELIAKLDAFLDNTLSTIVENNHHLIAQTVKENIDKLDNAELIDQIESKVGNDLQYIRLNGAIVGGLVGVLLAVVKAVVV